MMDREFDTRRSPLSVRLGRRLFPFRGFVGIPFLLICLLVCRPVTSSIPYTPLGLTFLLAGLFMRSWGVVGWYGVGQTAQSDRLITREGPYVYTRNPRYLGNLLLGMGGCTLAGLPQCYGPYLLLWAGLHVPIVLAEEATLRLHFGTAYEEYCQRAPRFLGTVAQAPSPVSQMRGLPWKLALRAERGTILGWLSLGLALWMWRTLLIS